MSEKKTEAAELAIRLRLRRKHLPFGLDRQLMTLAMDLLEEWPKKVTQKKKKSKAVA